MRLLYVCGLVSASEAVLSRCCGCTMVPTTSKACTGRDYCEVGFVTNGTKTSRQERWWSRPLKTLLRRTTLSWCVAVLTASLAASLSGSFWKTGACKTYCSGRGQRGVQTSSTGQRCIIPTRIHIFTLQERSPVSPCLITQRRISYERVCPSVCLSHLRVTSKRFRISKLCVALYDRGMFLSSWGQISPSRI